MLRFRELPSKVTCFVWWAMQGRIPSLIALSRKGHNAGATICGYCSEAEEDSDHILISCPYAKDVWDCTYSWCSIPKHQCKTVDEMIELANSWGNCRIRRNNFISITYGTLWWIWKARCARVFKGNHIPSVKVVEFIKSQVFTWVK